MPNQGWLKTVRMALGLTSAQLAKKIGTQAPGINQFENNEVTKKATLGSLDRAARAMNCRLVWAIVPEPGYGSLSEIVEYRARRLAEKTVRSVDQTMKLESQGIHSEDSSKKIIELTMDLTGKVIPASGKLWTMKIMGDYIFTIRKDYFNRR